MLIYTLIYIFLTLASFCGSTLDSPGLVFDLLSRFSVWALYAYAPPPPRTFSTYITLRLNSGVRKLECETNFFQPRSSQKWLMTLH